MAVTASVQREDCEVIQPERFHGLLPAAGMLVATVKEQQRFGGRRRGEPGSIE